MVLFVMVDEVVVVVQDELERFRGREIWNRIELKRGKVQSSKRNGKLIYMMTCDVMSSPGKLGKSSCELVVHELLPAKERRVALAVMSSAL